MKICVHWREESISRWLQEARCKRLCHLCSKTTDIQSSLSLIHDSSDFHSASSEPTHVALLLDECFPVKTGIDNQSATHFFYDLLRRSCCFGTRWWFLAHNSCHAVRLQGDMVASGFQTIKSKFYEKFCTISFFITSTNY